MGDIRQAGCWRELQSGLVPSPASVAIFNLWWVNDFEEGPVRQRFDGFRFFHEHAGGPVANWQCGKVRIRRSQLKRRQAFRTTVKSPGVFRVGKVAK